MSECDIAASTNSETSVYFGAHPDLERIVHIRAGRRRWRPTCRKLKLTLSRRRCVEGNIILGEVRRRRTFT